MKLYVLQENLAKGISIVNRFISPRAQLPILNNVLLATEKGRLRLSGTNLEMGINYWIGAKIEKEGTISVPARALNEFISFLPPGKIELEVKNNVLTVKSGTYLANFVGLPSSEFPNIPVSEKKETVSFSSEKLIKAISQTVFAVGTDKGRPIFSGILFKIREGKLILVATDGYRLSFKETEEIKETLEVEIFKKGLIIPGRTLLEIGRILADQAKEEKIGLTISSSSNQVIFSTKDSEIVSRLIEGKFPEFEKFIPRSKTTKIILEREDFLRGIKMAAVFARETANIVRLKIKGGILKISANAPQIGENLIGLEVKQEGEDNQIAFNFRYLVDFLNSVDCSQVSLEMTTSLSSAVFRPVGDSSYFHIIMPVMVQEESSQFGE